MDKDNKRILQDDLTTLKSTDRLLPIANISKIMKNPIPSHAKVSREAKEIMQKSASEFIAIISCRAKELCDIEARRTVTGDDLIRAMEDLDMPFYAEITKKYFVQYKNMNKDDKIKRYYERRNNEDEGNNYNE